jgi:hypothetical protein
MQCGHLNRSGLEVPTHRVADEDNGAIVPPQVVAQVVTHPTAGAHSRTRDDDGIAAHAPARLRRICDALPQSAWIGLTACMQARKVVGYRLDVVVVEAREQTDVYWRKIRPPTIHGIVDLPAQILVVLPGNPGYGVAAIALAGRSMTPQSPGRRAKDGDLPIARSASIRSVASGACFEQLRPPIEIRLAASCLREFLLTRRDSVKREPATWRAGLP